MLEDAKGFKCEDTSIKCPASGVYPYQEYGVLYNWPAALTACPPGTHLPSDEEWHSLESFFATGVCNPSRIGEDNNNHCVPAGTILKGKDNYKAEWSENTTGFLALPAGRRYPSGSNPRFEALGDLVTFWSSTVNENPITRTLDTIAGVRQSRGIPSWGHYVRCVQ